MDGSSEKPATSTLIVGIGASAGGLEAFRELFARLANDEKLALVLVQHLDPDHKSLLQELLSKRTTTPVHTAEDGMAVEAGNIYLIPPGGALTITDGKLKVDPFESPRGQRRPIDMFLASLAKDAGPNAVAIILSGTGSDGSEGVKAIKESGGLVIAQDPRQAAYDGMPRSAVASGAVDLTLTIQDMAEVLKDYRNRRSGVEPAIDSDHAFVERVFRHVRFHTGHDFTQYKHSTLMRRLTVRMAVTGINSPHAYLERLLQDGNEARKLQQDVLINVTEFFRDKEPFENLRTQVIPALFDGKGKGDEIRVWVPGCSTGEEAYSIGMLMLSELERLDARPKITIFGTDIDDNALQVARSGRYPNSIVGEVPRDFVDSYLVPTADGYDIGTKLRKTVRFSHHSLIKDPPFSRIDLVSCRNLLIYFERTLQQQALKVFHYALKPNGYLFLGTSESVSNLHDGFDELSVRNHLFQRDQSPSKPLNLPIGLLNGGRRSTADDGHGSGFSGTTQAIREAILSRHAPPFIATSDEGIVTFMSKGAERFVRVREGMLDTRLVNLIHPALQSTIRRLANQSNIGEGETISVEFEGRIDGEDISLEVRSECLPTGERFYIFVEGGAVHDDNVRRLHASAGDENAYIRELEQELEDARQTVRTTVEELETSNEELKSSNEEMMSMNEELQSANEELSTTNEELQSRLAEVHELNSDLNDFIASTDLPTVFLDADLRVRRFTPPASLYFRFVDTDLGRPLGDIASDLPIDDLLNACREVYDTGKARQEDLVSRVGEIEVMARIAPSLDTDENIRGVVFSLIDVTELRAHARDLEKAQTAAQRRLAEVNELYKVSPAAMALIGPDLTYLRVNDKLAAINGISREDHFGKTVSEVVPDLGDAVVAPVRHVFETGEPLLAQEVVGYTAANPGSERSWIVDWYPLKTDAEIIAVGVNVTDVTDQREMQAELKRVMRELQHRVKNMLANVAALINRARRDDRDPDVILETLYSRIVALGNTHEMLTSENWNSLTVMDLIRPELNDVYGDDAIDIRGPVIHCNSRAALSLGMAIHELATNAAKYGALKHEHATLSISWSRVDEGSGEMFRFRWAERGLPNLSKPEREGFGTTLIASTVERTLSGKVDLSWEPNGLTYVFEIPIGNVSEQAETVSEHIF